MHPHYLRRYFNERVFRVLGEVPADVARAACPVLAVSGELDGWAGPSHLARLQRAAARGTSVTISNSGHMCPADAPAAVVATVRACLDGG